MLISWKELALTKKEILKKTFSDPQWTWCYIAVIFPWDDISSQAYVRMKQKFWREVWLDVHIINQGMTSVSDIFSFIDSCNTDEKCVGIIVQLPLPDRATDSYTEIMARVSPSKDIDSLWWVLFGMTHLWTSDILWATPQAVISLMQHHNIDYGQWTIITILWQSKLIWRPLADYLMNAWATVQTVNERTDPDYVRDLCKKSDIILSATWVLHLIDESYIRHDWSQYMIDIWRWKLDWKPAWDVNPAIEKHVAWLSPVPGWVWPLTIMSLFENVVKIKNEQ